MDIGNGCGIMKFKGEFIEKILAIKYKMSVPH
jgi:hypothetical protein